MGNVKENGNVCCTEHETRAHSDGEVLGIAITVGEKNVSFKRLFPALRLHYGPEQKITQQK